MYRDIKHLAMIFGVLVLEIIPYCWNNISLLGVRMISIGNLTRYFSNKSIKIVVILMIHCKYVENFSYVLFRCFPYPKLIIVNSDTIPTG